MNSLLLNAGTLMGYGLVAYSYLGLPILLMGISLIRKRATGGTRADSKPTPRVAVVVAAHNEQSVIDHMIGACLALDYPHDRIRIFIGDDGSSDATVERAQAFAEPRLSIRAYSSRRGKISVVNDLMADPELRAFDPRITLFCDAKSVLSPNTVNAIVDSFADPNVGCVALKLRMESESGKARGEGLYWKYEMKLKALEDQLGCVMGCNGGGFGMLTELFEPIAPGTIVEDFVLSLGVLMKGYQIRFASHAEVRQPACADVRSEWLRKVRIGAGNYQALGPCAPLLNPFYGMPSLVFWGHKVLRWFTPFLLLLAWGCDAVALGGSTGIAHTAHLASLSVALFIIAASLISWTRPNDPRVPALIRLSGYFGLMNYALLAGFGRWVRRTQQVTWEKADRTWTPAKGQA